jgi:hypothetical protein
VNKNEPKTGVFADFLFFWYTGNIFLSKFSKQSSVKSKNGADFFNGVQVGVGILTSKIRHENDDILKNALRKKVLEYF